MCVKGDAHFFAAIPSGDWSSVDLLAERDDGMVLAKLLEAIH